MSPRPLACVLLEVICRLNPMFVNSLVDRQGSFGVSVETLDDRLFVLARSGSDRRGALDRQASERLANGAHLALRQRVPLVMELASSGVDVDDGIDALHGWGIAASAVASCSGVVPVLAAVKGPVFSGPALMLGLCDLVAMNEEAVAFVSGPSMVAQFTGVQLTQADLGGMGVHVRTSGVCAIQSTEPREALLDALSYLPANTDEEPATIDTGDPPDRLVPELRDIVPATETASYDVRAVVASVADLGDVLELWGGWAAHLVTALCRIDGRAVGVVANQPRSLAGTLDIAASQKGARFVRLCDAFNLPVITLVDTPGFLPGKDLEWRGMIRHGAELVFAYAEATVPRISLILRKAFGGAYIAMDSRGLGSTLCLAWPGAQTAVMGAREAGQILYRRLDGAERAEREQDYASRFLSPWPASERGFIDMVVDPSETRAQLAKALHVLGSRRERLVGRKHDAGPM
jgi:acetyl-CoA carboxylase carboxyltransferase component